VLLLLFTAPIGLRAEASRMLGLPQKVSDCITNAQGGCRGLAVRQVSPTNAANTVRITALTVGRTLEFTTTCSAGMAAVTVTVSTESTFSNPLTIDTFAAAASLTQQYDVTTKGMVLQLSPMTFPYIQTSVASCGAGNTSTLSVALKGL